MVVRHLLAILVLPTTVTVVVPFVLLEQKWKWPSDGIDIVLLVLGAVVAAAGLVLAGATVRQFATQGRGTLAPWDPTQRLVATGLYRHARNPMITGVLAIVIGEACILRSTPTLVWAGVFFLMNAIYLPLIEEPGLERRFGAAYEDYRRNVPRWIPRLRPWSP